MKLTIRYKNNQGKKAILLPDTDSMEGIAEKMYAVVGANDRSDWRRARMLLVDKFGGAHLINGFEILDAYLEET
jgi:hypothetical protein